MSTALYRISSSLNPTYAEVGKKHGTEVCSIRVQVLYEGAGFPNGANFQCFVGAILCRGIFGIDDPSPRVPRPRELEATFAELAALLEPAEKMVKKAGKTFRTIVNKVLIKRYGSPPHVTEGPTAHHDGMHVGDAITFHAIAHPGVSIYGMLPAVPFDTAQSFGWTDTLY